MSGRMFFEKLASLLGTGAPRASKPDVKTAVAELLVTASLIDGHMNEAEIEACNRLLKAKFDLDELLGHRYDADTQEPLWV